MKPVREPCFKSKFAQTRKRQTVTTESPQPKRRKMDESSANKYQEEAGGMEEVWSGKVRTERQTGSLESSRSVLVSGRDTRYMRMCT